MTLCPRRGVVVSALVVLSLAAACGGDDPDTADPGAAVGTGDDDGSGGEENGGDGSGRPAGETVTLRMINLVGHTEGGIDVDVAGPGEDFSLVRYQTVAYGEIAEIEVPDEFGVTLWRVGTEEVVGPPVSVFGDTPTGQVVVVRDEAAGTLGADPEDRVEGFATVGVVSAIDDPDPNRAYLPTDDSGTCLYGVSPEPSPDDNFPTTNYATPEDGGDTSGISPLTLVSDRVLYVEPGPQLMAWAVQDEDVFEQGEDCSNRAFETEIDAEDGRAVFIAFYGDSSDVQVTVYNE